MPSVYWSASLLWFFFFLSAFSLWRKSFKFISKINISEYKHSHNLSKASYIKATALSCQRNNLIKILSNDFDEGERSTSSISKHEYICISNDSTCPEHYEQDYCRNTINTICCTESTCTAYWKLDNREPRALCLTPALIWREISVKSHLKIQIPLQSCNHKIDSPKLMVIKRTSLCCSKMKLWLNVKGTSKVFQPHNYFSLNSLISADKQTGIAMLYSQNNCIALSSFSPFW